LDFIQLETSATQSEIFDVKSVTAAGQHNDFPSPAVALDRPPNRPNMFGQTMGLTQLGPVLCAYNLNTNCPD